MAQLIKTICQMCYFYCGLDITVENGRIHKVEGNREHPVNRGRLCAKGLACAQIVTDPNRLRTPLRRVGERGSGEWEQISWDRALDEIAERLLAIRDKFGPKYVGYFWNQAPGWVTNFQYMWRFMNALGSPNVFSQGHLCFVPRALAHRATFGQYPEPDYERSNCIMLIGYNPVFTSPVNYAARILWAKRRGAKLIVIDPRFTNTASKADLFLQPRPGTDGALILSMIQVIIEENLYDEKFVEEWTKGFSRLKESVKDYIPDKVTSITWVEPDKIRDAARMIAKMKPAVIVEGNGLDMHTNVVQTVRTTSILRSLISSIDEPGGSVLVPRLPSIDIKRHGLPSCETQYHGSLAPDFNSKSVCQYQLSAKGGWGLQGVEMADSLATEKPFKIKALIVQGADPIATLADTNYMREVIKKVEFLVTFDLFGNTATGQIADMVLPAASFLERNLVLYYRYRPSADCNIIAMQNQCVPPVEGSKSDLDFIFALAHRVGLKKYFPWENVIEAFDWQLAPNGVNVAWLRKHPEGYVRKYKPKELYRKYEREGFDTPSMKIELISSIFEEHGFNPFPAFIEPAESAVSEPELAIKYPLIGSTGLKLGIYTHTQFRTLPWIREIEPDPFGEINPSTAKERGIKDGDWIIVESTRGSIRIRARVRMSVQPGVVMITHGFGEPYAGGGDFANVITSEKERDPISGATGNRSFLCDIKRAET